MANTPNNICQYYSINKHMGLARENAQQQNAEKQKQGTNHSFPSLIANQIEFDRIDCPQGNHGLTPIILSAQRSDVRVIA
jgi:hypothetical protein